MTPEEWSYNEKIFNRLQFGASEILFCELLCQDILIHLN